MYIYIYMCTCTTPATPRADAERPGPETPRA